MTGTASARQVIHESIDSTNREAERLFRGGDPGPVWIAAREQTQGRGRSGRDWVSRRGNLFATYLFPYPGTASDAPRLGFVAALAVSDGVAHLAPEAQVTLKWPNDCLLNDRKVSGLLLENFGARTMGPQGIAVGIGINLSHGPEAADARWPPISIAEVTGAAPALEPALEALTNAMGHWIDRFLADGFAPIREAWCARAAHLGREITIARPNGPVSGRFTDLDIDGTLILETSGGPVTVAAGDVLLGEGTHAARN